VHLPALSCAICGEAAAAAEKTILLRIAVMARGMAHKLVVTSRSRQPHDSKRIHRADDATGGVGMPSVKH